MQRTCLRDLDVSDKPARDRPHECSVYLVYIILFIHRHRRRRRRAARSFIRVEYLNIGIRPMQIRCVTRALRGIRTAQTIIYARTSFLSYETCRA